MLRFVATADDAPASRPGDLTLVLDTAWTPDAGARPDVVSLRPSIAAVLERHDLFAESLAAIDRWAEATGIADVLALEGVTYWYRMRESTWHWVHERLLWRLVLAAIDPAGNQRDVSVPWNEEALIDVARGLGLAVEVVGRPTPDPAPAARPPTPEPVRAKQPVRASSRGRGIRSRLRRFYRRFGPKPTPPPEPEPRRRERLLDERFERLSRLAAPRVVVLTLPNAYQRVGSAEDGPPRDPNLGTVIAALEAAGQAPIIVGWGMDRTSPAHWEIVEQDDRLLPSYYVQFRWFRPEDVERADGVVADVAAALDALPPVPLDLADLDLAPAVLDAIRGTAERLIRSDVHELARVQRFLEAVRPSAIVLTHEGRRTPWLIAGARTNTPSFAVQHGVLYPAHPGYADRRHPALILPTCTFVFGDYERRVLLGGAYRPDEVAVSGSPRVDLDAATSVTDPAGERAAVRRELGVADGDRMLVVSTLYLPFVRRSHLVHMLAVLLDGPLPGVHLVFKQHPGELDEGPYRELVTGLARAGGYAPPPISMVREIDLYRLLRAADAHLGQQSTVLTDAVMADTCNLIAMVQASADILGYVPAGVARPVHDIAELREALRDPQPPDPDARQAFLDDHFRPGDASARIAATIAAAVGQPVPVDTAGRP
ncbi:MAG TPA: hypothetical protein VIM25_03350 [Candidatus Limnocylindrales bacterium]